MSVSTVLMILGIIILIGTVIATAVDKTWENMKKTTEYMKQIREDLEKINEIIKKTEELLRWK